MTVHLVGAGPGDPGFVTVRGAELLAIADVVIHDRLVDRGILQLVRSGALVIDAGKQSGGASITQEEINALLIAHGQIDQVVVRLKGGDPYVFGRGGEEAAALQSAGIAYSVVPGVSAISAAPGAAGIPVTMRGVSSSMIVVAGQDAARSDNEALLDWDELGKSRSTLVFLMAVARRAEISKALISHGRSPDTPVAVIERATTPEQRSRRCALSELGDLGIDHSATIVIGEVAALSFASYEDRPLSGLSVALTGLDAEWGSLATALQNMGARTIACQTIAIEPPGDHGKALRRALEKKDEYSWIVVASRNAVEAVLGVVRDARGVAGPKIAAIGPATALALSEHGVVADLVASEANAEGLLAAFPVADSKDGKVLLPRASIGRDVLPDGIRARGWQVEVIEAYRTIGLAVSPQSLVELTSAHAVVFTSSSTVRALLSQVDKNDLPHLVVSIGPATTATLLAYGIPVALEATRHDAIGIAESLALYFHNTDA